MVKSKTKAKTGRPLAKIDPAQVEQLAAIQCSYAEMAAVLGCDPKTLSNRFSQAIEKGREVGKSSLKRAQFKMAMGGNATMLIWLGKQHLGQHDKQSHEVSGPEGGPIEVKINELRDRFTRRIDGIASRIGTNGSHQNAHSPGTRGAGV